jgi:IrrE N-terminal-like domain
MKRTKGNEVPPTSKIKIRQTTTRIREIFQLANNKVSMIKFIEFILPPMMPNFYWEVLTEEEMGIDEARTYPDKALIQIREDVYKKAWDGGRREQFTLAHELGHLVMHAGLQKSPSYARNNQEHPIFKDSEWQADQFSAEFLMPWEAAKQCKSVDEIMDKFFVSRNAAEIRYRDINKNC